MSLENTVLDFRSDTFTMPSPGMREAMARAEVGDDVFREDPTVRRLEERIAELFGREASLFVPSGTMANLIGIALHCQRGDEVIMERRTHSFAHEVGGGGRCSASCSTCWTAPRASSPRTRCGPSSATRTCTSRSAG